MVKERGWSGCVYAVILAVLGMTAALSLCEGAANYAPTLTGGCRSFLAGISGSFVPWVEDADMWETFTFQVTSIPAHGSASIVSNRIVFTPAIGWIGSDSFSYQVADHGGYAISGTAAVRVYSDADLINCKKISTVYTSGANNGQLQSRTKSNFCTFYSVSNTRLTDTGVQVAMDYFINWPSDGTAPKAVVVLIGGGDLNMSLAGNTATGVADTSGGGNFVVRTAQLFADAGYLTIAINKPSDQPPAGSTDTNADADHYRISVKHAVDILTILKHINTENLDVFIAGTSRGTISAVALNLMAAGISLSSSLTSDPNDAHVYIGKPGVSNLQAAFVQRPVHVLWHTNDLCSETTPANSQILYNNLSAVTAASHDAASLGVRVTVAGSGVSPDVCGAFDYHGYLGIEPTAVGYITAWLDSQITALAGSKRPQALFATIGASGGPASIDLSPLTKTDKKTALSYALLNTTTSLGGSVSLSGSIATYTPPADAATKTDYFVYVVTDGLGGVNSAVAEIRNGSHLPVTIGGTTLYYSTIYDGYDDAVDNETVQIQAQAFTGDLLLAKGTSVVLSGGYSWDNLINPGWTTVIGKMTVKGSGKVTVEKLIIR